MKIAIAGVWHETNTLVSIKSAKENFTNFGWYKEQELIDAFMGTKTVMGGYLDVLNENNLKIVPTFGAYATPSGTITLDTFEEILENLLAELVKNLPFDGLLLELHGAQVVENIDDPEALIVARVREAIGNIKLAVVTDFHANMSEQRLKFVDLWTGYRTNPHIDTYQTGKRSAQLLLEILQNDKSFDLDFKSLPILYSPIQQSTSDLPFKLFLNKAKEVKEEYDLVDLIVHGGYSFADVAHAGLSFTAVSEAKDDRTRLAALEEMAKFAEEQKSNIQQEIIEINEVIKILEQERSSRIAIADIADNINGGSAGDSTNVLGEILKTDRKILASICDPKAIQALVGSQEGDVVTLKVGGWSGPLVGAPLQITGKLIYLGEGSYTHTGKMYTGQSFTMGRAAVVEFENGSILLQTLPQQPNDLEMFRCIGINPDEFDCLLLKGAIALRATWAEQVDIFINASSLGTTDCNLSRLHLEKLKNKVWPLKNL